eukprot:7382352-Prymnesium_polylepis.1
MRKRRFDPRRSAHLALECDRDRLKAAVRVQADASPLQRWPKVLRRRVVEHQEGGHLLGERHAVEDGVDVEAVAHPVRGSAWQDLVQGAHRCLAVGCWGAHELSLNVLPRV